MPTLRSIVFTLLFLIFSAVSASHAFAQTVKIVSSGASEIGNLNWQTIYQIANTGIEFRAVINPPGQSGYLWTFTGSPQITGGSATGRIVAVKWTARGNYTVSVSYNGGAPVTVNVVVTTEPDEIELTPRPCSDEPQLRSVTGQVPTFINFKNTTNETVKVLWLDYSTPGQRVLYSTLAPGQNVYQQMWLTQPWVVTDELEKCIGIYEPINQTGRATIVNVSKVEFEKILPDSEPLSLNPNAEGGRRFYPDKQTPGETNIIRNQVRVKATLSQYLPNKKIYFRSFDVDDPSANTAPIDDDSGANANAEDNHGMVGTSKAGLFDTSQFPACTKDAATNLWGCPVDAGGVAIINFTTTMNPGDNFVIAASPDAGYLNGITVNGINLRDASLVTLPIPPEPNPSMPFALARGARSEMLTVWRKLHLEVDSMGNVGTSNNVTGKISAAMLIPNPDCNPLAPPNPSPSAPCNPNFTRYDLTKDDGNALNLDINRFEKGRIVIGNRKFTVLANNGTSVLLGDSSLSRKMTGKSFILYDDDDYNEDDGGSLDGDKNEPIVELSESLKYLSIEDGNYPAPDGKPKNIYASAYITPEYNWSKNVMHYNQTNLPFVLNIPSGDVPAKVNENRNSLSDEKDDFWIAYLLIAYQGETTKDGDGDGFTLGQGPPTNITNLCDCYQNSTCVGRSCSIFPKGVSGSLIYQEVMQDSDRTAVRDYNITIMSKGTTAPHEIGHQFGLNGDNRDPITNMSTRTVAIYEIMDYPHYFAEADSYKLHPEHINILRRRVKSPGE